MLNCLRYVQNQLGGSRKYSNFDKQDSDTQLSRWRFKRVAHLVNTLLQQSPSNHHARESPKQRGIVETQGAAVD